MSKYGTPAARAYQAGQPKKTDPTVASKAILSMTETIKAQDKETLEVSLTLSRLRALVVLRDHTESEIRQETVRAVQEGATWKEVGECLRTSPQAAWERYRLIRSAAGGLAVPEGTQELPFGLNDE